MWIILARLKNARVVTLSPTFFAASTVKSMECWRQWYFPFYAEFMEELEALPQEFILTISLSSQNQFLKLYFMLAFEWSKTACEQDELLYSKRPSTFADGLFSGAAKGLVSTFSEKVKIVEVLLVRLKTLRQ